jgi:hypothetical protein
MYAGVKMRVPGYRRDRRRGERSCGPWHGAVALAVLLVSVAAHAVRGPQPAVRLPLADLGFPGVSQSFQDAGAAMLTVHFVDNTHILLTYGLRGLVERIKDDPPTDDDRAVAALLLELPSGKVLARTRWHLHDHGQYLWAIGNGRFLLRIRSTLTSIAPLANLASDDAFRQTRFASLPGVIDAVVVSPEGDLVTVETSPPRKPPPERTVFFVNEPQEKEPDPLETFHFMRTEGIGSLESPLLAISAGSVRARGTATLPMNGRGYLMAKSEKRNRWAVEFEGFDGDNRKLSYVDSSCAPRMVLVSPSQFVVFSCRGADDRIMLSSFNFLPLETWEEPLGESIGSTHFAYAPQAGRFALSRMISSAPSSTPGTTSVGAGEANSQEVRLYQIESGDLLLKLSCSPASRTGQNFDVSADGMSVLVVRGGVIEVYRMPPLSAKDKQELAEVQQREPPVPHSNLVKLKHITPEPTESVAEAAAASDKAQATQPAAPATPVTAAPAAPVPAATASRPPAVASDNAPANAGDVETRRKPPSLLNPGETVDNGKKSPQ